MVGGKLGSRLQDRGKLRLQRCGDPPMQGLTRAAHQRVLEQIFRRRRRAALKDEAGLDEAPQCLPQLRYPFVAQLERAAGFARDDTPEAKLGKLRALIAEGAAEPDEITLIAELLALPNAAAKLDLSPQRKREKLLAGLLHQLEALAHSHPVLTVFEDAHWIDPDFARPD